MTDLAKSFAGVTALAGMTFTVDPGRTVGFLGPNGAGTTTAMRYVLGLETPDAGSVAWGGRPLDQATRLTFGYMPDERGLYPRMKIAEQLAYFGRLSGMTSSDAEADAGHWLDRMGALRAGGGHPCRASSPRNAIAAAALWRRHEST